jgi:hypothetical protein
MRACGTGRKFAEYDQHVYLREKCRLDGNFCPMPLIYDWICFCILVFPEKYNYVIMG